MATVVSVQIRLPEPLSSEEASRLAEETAPKYKEAPGLVRKYFVRGEDGLTWGGVYLWETREDAEALFDEEWQERVKETYGSPPTMEWLDCALVLDNRHGEVVTD
jgi:hypothetical protein